MIIEAEDVRNVEGFADVPKVPSHQNSINVPLNIVADLVTLRFRDLNFSRSNTGPVTGCVEGFHDFLHSLLESTAAGSFRAL
jgi:hypothetical protein